MEESLAAGFDVSKAVLSMGPFNRGRFFTFVPDSMSSDKIVFPSVPDIPSGIANRALAGFLNEVTFRGAASLVVEDDLAGPSDPGIGRWPVPSAFLENRVIHWFDLEEGTAQDTVKLMKQYCASHILNAFICSERIPSLGLTNGQVVPDDLATKVASSLFAVIAYAFDGTSYAVWASHVPERR